MKSLAIFSPNRDGYSETFIQAHRNLPFKIKVYYGGWLPNKLEGFGSLYKFNFIEKVKYKLIENLNVSEHALAFSLSRQKIDCVLAEYGPTACCTLKVVKKLKIPMVVHFHGFDASRKSTLDQFGVQYKEVFKYAFKIIVVSKQMGINLIKLGCPANKIELAVYGPNPIYFENSPILESQQFLAVGRFTGKKAPNLTILAFKKVVTTFPSAKLIMVGDGELFESCKKLARELLLDKHIGFTGVLSPIEINRLMNKSIAFVQHSIVAENGDSEGTPVAILEAQAAGLPVISTYHAGIPDVVINNETGLLVEEQDINGMANNMIRILSEKGLAEKLGLAGRKRILENFSMEKHLVALTNILKT